MLQRDDEEGNAARSRFWQVVAGFSFGLWSLMVPISARWVVDSLQEMSTAQAAYAVEQTRRNEIFETRLARYEERHTFILLQLSKIQSDHDRILNESLSRHP